MKKSEHTHTHINQDKKIALYDKWRACDIVEIRRLFYMLGETRFLYCIVPRNQQNWLDKLLFRKNPVITYPHSHMLYQATKKLYINYNCFFSVWVQFWMFAILKFIMHAVLYKVRGSWLHFVCDLRFFVFSSFNSKGAMAS